MKWTITLIDSGVVIDGAGSEESGAIITIVGATGLICLYEIPQYGGEPRLVGHSKNIFEAMKEAESWT